MKKTISVLLALLLLLGAVPFVPFAAAEESAFAAGDILEYGSITDSNHSGGWWETISVWLNEHFLTTAFSAAQQENILAEPLTNDYWYVGSGAGGNGAHRYDAPATADKIFLPACPTRRKPCLAKRPPARGPA